MAGIVFRSIKWKNLLATGNSEIEVRLDSGGRTLIIGENGAGKSTMLDAICYALYGKAFRNINKPQLINSVNERDMRVECQFEIGKIKYKIVRGMKPNLFEIYENDVLVNQDSTARDYQKYLEQNVLSMNYKSFTQIIVLGSSNFTPFMQLTAADRRAVIEDLLDIQIFSQMNMILRTRLSDNKQELRDHEQRIAVIKEKIDLQQSHIRKMREKDSAQKQTYLDEIEKSNKEIGGLEDDIKKLKAEESSLWDTIKDCDEVQSRLNTMNSIKDGIESRKKQILKETRFYEGNDTCPTCKQNIDSDFKDATLKQMNDKLAAIDSGLSELVEDAEQEADRLREIAKVQEKIRNTQLSTTNVQSKITAAQNYIAKMRSGLNSVDSVEEDIDSEDKLREFQDELVRLQNVRAGLMDDMNYYRIAEELLKDRGIKARIIRHYLPVMNKLINKYLTSLDFYIDFQLDENFKESILSTHRSEFSYNSFSEGQKFRINIAILLAWRDIARMKNSANTNILVLDEVFDSSLDGSGVDDFMKLLNIVSSDNNSVYVISHRGAAMADRFDQTIEYRLDRGFTTLSTE